MRSKQSHVSISHYKVIQVWSMKQFSCSQTPSLWKSVNSNTNNACCWGEKESMEKRMNVVFNRNQRRIVKWLAFLKENFSKQREEKMLGVFSVLAYVIGTKPLLTCLSFWLKLSHLRVWPFLLHGFCFSINNWNKSQSSLETTSCKCHTIQN